jgi:hypothetical protein
MSILTACKINLSEYQAGRNNKGILLFNKHVKPHPFLKSLYNTKSCVDLDSNATTQLIHAIKHNQVEKITTVVGLGMSPFGPSFMSPVYTVPGLKLGGQLESSPFYCLELHRYHHAAIASNCGNNNNLKRLVYIADSINLALINSYIHYQKFAPINHITIKEVNDYDWSDPVMTNYLNCYTEKLVALLEKDITILKQNPIDYVATQALQQILKFAKIHNKTASEDLIKSSIQYVLGTIIAFGDISFSPGLKNEWRVVYTHSAARPFRVIAEWLRQSLHHQNKLSLALNNIVSIEVKIGRNKPPYFPEPNYQPFLHHWLEDLGNEDSSKIVNYLSSPRLTDEDDTHAKRRIFDACCLLGVDVESVDYNALLEKSIQYIDEVIKPVIHNHEALIHEFSELNQSCFNS